MNLSGHCLVTKSLFVCSFAVERELDIVFHAIYLLDGYIPDMRKVGLETIETENNLIDQEFNLYVATSHPIGGSGS